MGETRAMWQRRSWLRVRPPGQYAMGAAVAAVAGALALSAALGDRAGAVATHSVDLVGTGQAADLALAGSTFDDVLVALVDTDLSIGLPIDGFTTIDDVPVDVVSDPLHDAVVLRTNAPTALASLSGGVLAGLDLEVMLTVDWDEDAVIPDIDPTIVLAIKVAGQTLADLYPAWADGALPGLPDDVVTFTDAILTFTPDGGSIDPSALPADVAAFYAAGETLVLEAGAGLLAELDLAAMPTARAVAELLGMDPADVPLVAGALADHAALLFDAGATLDAGQFALDGPFEIDSARLETWMRRGDVSVPGLELPELRLRIGPAPERLPSVLVHDVVDVTTGGTTNRFDYEFTLQDGADLRVAASASTFDVPFGLDWMGPFSDVQLELAADADGNVDGSFAATVPIGAGPPHPRIRIAIEDDPVGTRAEVSIDGDVAIADLVAWATRTGSGDPPTAFPGSAFAPADLDDVVLHDVELAFETGSDRTLLSLFASASGIEAFDADLDVTLLAAIEDTPGTAPTLLVALRVVDPECAGGTCIRLHQVLPLPGGDLAADLTVPAVNFATVQPDGAAFDATGLGTDATAFLTGVLGEPPDDSVELAGDLQLSADVPLTDLAAPLASIGVTVSPADALRVEGSLGVTLSDFATLQVDTFELAAQLPAATFALPPGLPDWIGSSGDATADPVEWSTQPWTAFLRFAEGAPADDADDVLALGATVDGITTSLLGEPPAEFGLEVAFAGTPATGDWSATATGTMGTWTQPFGVEWLTVDGATFVLGIESDDGVVAPSVALTGQFTLGTGATATTLQVAIDLQGVDPFVASITVTLLDEVTLGDLATELFGGTLGAPPALLSAGVGPGEVTVRVTGEGEFSLGGTMRAGFAPFGERIGVCAMFHAEYSPAQPVPGVVVGVSPEPLSLSDLLPDDVELPVDFDLVTDAPSCGTDDSGPDDAGFAFVYNTIDGLDPDDPALAPSVRDWFAPLFGGSPGPLDRVGDDLSVLGSFGVPAPLDEMLRGLGVEPNVLLSGSLPLPTPDGSGGFDVELGGVDIALGLRLRDGLLPDFVDGVDLRLRAAISLPSEGSLDAPSLSVGMEGSMFLKLKQGVEPALADSLAGIGLELPTSTSGALTDPCPRGGSRQAGYAVVMTDPGDPLAGILPTFDEVEGNYCYDLLGVTLGGELEITPPARIQATLFADLSSLNAQVGDDWGWAPLGFDEVLIRQLTGQLTLALDPSTAPFTLEVKLGVGGNFQLLGKDVSGAVQAGVKIDPVVVPPKPPTFVPIFDGLRISLPDGFATQDLLDIYASLEDALRAAAGTPSTQPSLLDGIDAAAIPDIEVRNLFFSISPFGVQELCIDQGLVLRGDLYVDPDPSSNPMPDGLCNRQTGEIEEVEPSPGVPAPASGLCVDRKAEGCVAGVNVSLTPAGIIAEGSLAGFEAGPIELLDTALELRLTLAEQYLKLRGGAFVDLGDGSRPGGEMTLQLLPGSIRYYGHLEDIFGFDATVEGSANVDLLALLNGEPPATMRIRAVLASDDHPVGPGADGAHVDYAAELEAQAAEVLAAIQRALADIEQFLTDLTTDPIGTLATLTTELTALGVESGHVPAWVADIVGDIAGWVDQAATNDDTLTLQDVLEGPSFAGIPGPYFPEEETCAAREPITGAVLLTIAFDPDTLEVTLELVEGTVKDGVCWTIVPSPLTLGNGLAGTWVDPRCVGFEEQGGCWLVPPFSVPGAGLCDVLGLSPCSVDALWDEHLAPLMDDVLDDAVAAFAGASDVAALIDDLTAIFDGGATGPLLQLRCAELEGLISDLDGSAVRVGIELAVAGDPYGLGVDWNFGSFDGSVESLIGSLFGTITPFACEPLPDHVTQDPHTAGGAGTPGGPPPPANLSISATPLTVVENGAVTLAGTFDRPLAAATIVTVDWGDGSTQDVTVAAAATALPAVQHTYRDDDPTGTPIDLVTVSATPDNGGAGSSRRVTIRNVAPRDVAVDASATAIDEDGTVSLDVSFSDAGPDDTHLIVVDWGDGTRDTYAPGAAISHRYRDDDPTATAQDTYAIAVSVVDDDRGIGTGSTSVTVRNVAPSAVAMTWPDDATEGAWVRYTVTFADPGGDDVHRVEIDWGGDADGFTAETTRFVRRGARTLTLTHRYRDDHPDTGTPSDVVRPAVRVLDDDTAASPALDVPVELFNVAPVIPADGLRLLDGLGLLDATCDVGAASPPREDCTDEDGTITLAGGFVDPGLDDTHVVTIDWGDGSDEEEVAVTGGARDFAATHRYLDDDPSGTSEDDYVIAVRIVDDDTGAGTGSTDVTVRNVAPAASVDADADGAVTVAADGGVAVSVQYSDPIAAGDGMTLRATDVAGDPLSAVVSAVDGDAGSTALSALLSVSAGDCVADAVANTNTCTWIVSSTPSAAGIFTDVAPGVYSVELVVTDDDLGRSSLPVTVTVLPEDARVWYVGPTFAATESALDGTATVELRATVRDITTAVTEDDPQWDPWPGDIRNASLTFSDRDASDAVLCGPVAADAVFDPFDVFDVDASVGVGTCDWTSDLGAANAAPWTVGTTAGGYYTRDDSSDDAIVTIARPLDEFITGGGYLVAERSSGVYASVPGSHANFGFHVKFNRKGTNLQGGVNLIVRSGGRVYQVKTNAMDSLGARGSGAQFEAKANITDITDQDAPRLIGGNYVLQMRMTDLSDEEATDTIGFSLWEYRKVKGAGATQLLLYSSSWTGNLTVEQVLGGGNLMVHAG